MKGLSGFNLPEHQEVISNFIYYIRVHIDNSGQEFEFSVAPELRIKNSNFNNGSFIPDIVIKNEGNTWNQPEIIIEVSRNRGYLTDIKKVKRAVKNIRSLKEGFVFNNRQVKVVEFQSQTLKKTEKVIQKYLTLT